MSSTRSQPSIACLGKAWRSSPQRSSAKPRRRTTRQKPTEVTMATTQTSTAYAPQVQSDEAVDTKLEVVTIPVSDIDRAKRFYEGLGWQVDADFSGDGWRVVQLTPPGSACSIQLGTAGVPGSAQGLFLVGA